MPRPSRERPALKTFKQLSLVLGQDLALEICKAMGGQQIYIPTFRTMSMDTRNQQIREAERNGMSVAELAKQWKLTKARISQIISMV